MCLPLLCFLTDNNKKTCNYLSRLNSLKTAASKKNEKKDRKGKYNTNRRKVKSGKKMR